MLVSWWIFVYAPFERNISYPIIWMTHPVTLLLPKSPRFVVIMLCTFYSVSYLFDKIDLLANLPSLGAVLVNVMLGRKHKYLIIN